MRVSQQLKLGKFRNLMSQGLDLWQSAVRDGWVGSGVACLVMSAMLLAVIAALLGPFQ
jgi:hypothetical protein